MSKKLGKIEKPSVEEFSYGRKLFCVPLLLSGKEAPEDYITLYDNYWFQVNEHIQKLEKTGKINKIYHESVFEDGQAGLDIIKKQNSKIHQILQSKISQGASFIAIEDKNILDEYVDLSMCLSLVRSPGVAEKIRKLYFEAANIRDQHIVKRIDETLKDSEVGLLVTVDSTRIRIQSNLSPDIHVFLVHPPALNDISRWFRDRNKDSTKKYSS